MPAETIDYPALVEGALVGVVRAVLARTAEEGLPGEHHFFLTFATAEEGVELPAFLAARYPDEMTIILQHRFWDLEVGDDGFGVTLSFDGKRHRLAVPFAALRAFADPAAGFGLRFGPAPDPADDDDGPAAPEPAPADPAGKVVSIDRFRRDS